MYVESHQRVGAKKGFQDSTQGSIRNLNIEARCRAMMHAARADLLSYVVSDHYYS
jgi:hypothetical protein